MLTLDDIPRKDETGQCRTIYLCQRRAEKSAIKYPILGKFLHIRDIRYERVLTEYLNEKERDKVVKVFTADGGYYRGKISAMKAHIKVYTVYDSEDESNNRFIRMTTFDFGELFLKLH